MTWVPCPCCDEHLCTVHGMHAFECPCPPIEEWEESPYMPDADPPRSRNIKLTDADWDALERIARENGLEWGGIPSRSEAVRLLIRRVIPDHPDPAACHNSRGGTKP